MIKEKGFSLMELLVVLAILAILAAIAYPVYQNYTIRAACDSGKAGLLQIDGLMNQLRTKYGVYNNADAKKTDSDAVIPVAIPFDGSSSKADFAITIENLTETTYTIKATTVSGGRLSGYSGTLTIDEKGQKGGTLGGKDVWAKGCSAL